MERNSTFFFTCDCVMKFVRELVLNIALENLEELLLKDA